MGQPISEIRRMSLWQYQACVDGYNQHHDPKTENALTSEEEEALWDWMNP